MTTTTAPAAIAFTAAHCDRFACAVHGVCTTTSCPTCQARCYDLSVREERCEARRARALAVVDRRSAGPLGAILLAVPGWLLLMPLLTGELFSLLLMPSVSSYASVAFLYVVAVALPGVAGFFLGTAWDRRAKPPGLRALDDALGVARM